MNRLTVASKSPSVTEREPRERIDRRADRGLDSFDKIYAAPPSYNSLSAKSGFGRAGAAAVPAAQPLGGRQEISRGGFGGGG